MIKDEVYFNKQIGTVYLTLNGNASTYIAVTPSGVTSYHSTYGEAIDNLIESYNFPEDESN